MDVKHFIDGNKAYVFLNSEIDGWVANYIAAQLYDYKEQGYKPVLKINSPGGSVFAGWTIVDAVVTTEADTHIIGLAASMAGVIVQFGKKRYANNNATGHAHPPSNAEGELLEIVRSQLKEALTKRSKLTEEEITNYIGDGGIDKFFSASEMLEKGLIDEIIQTQEQVIESENKTPLELYQVYNSIINTNETEMSELIEIKNTLGLSDNASKEKVNESIKELKNKYSESVENVKNLESEKQTLESEKTELENKLKEFEEQRAKDLVKNAIENGKIKEEKKEKWEEMAVNNYDLAKETLEGIADAGTVSISDLINEEGNGAKAFNKMTEEEKADLARTNPEAYNKEIEKLEIN